MKSSMKEIVIEMEALRTKGKQEQQANEVKSPKLG